MTTSILTNLSDPDIVDLGFDSTMSEEWQGRYDNYSDYYEIKFEGDNAYLSASSRNSDCFIARKIKVDIAEYPYLNWTWRANALPHEGDESRKKTCDVAASIAIVLNKSKILPKSIKYSWSTTLEEDTRTKSPFAFWPARCDVIVKESGDQNKGQWVKEKVNILEHYKELYSKDNVKSKQVNAIVIMTDSDSTGSFSSGDYDNIYFSKS